jgi:phytoene dehydrogenase-like protein
MSFFNGETSMKWQGDEYEVIILGSGLGGLIAGTYLSKKHLRVLLLKENQYHPSSEKIGYRFVPFSNFSEKRIQSTLLKRISKELDCPLFISDRVGAKRDERKQNVAFQTILPRARIDFFCERSMLQMELKREFPKEVAQIENFCNQMEKLWYLLKNEKEKKGFGSIFPIQPRYLIRRWWPFKTLPNGRMDEWLAPFSREFREFIQLQLISRGNLFSDQFSISLAGYLFFHNETDEWVSETDLESLKEEILKKFFQLGGRIEEIDGLERVEKRWRNGVILVTKKNEKTFQSQYLIFNSPLYRLSTLLGEKRRLLSKWGDRIQPRYVLIPLFLGIREKVVPVGMRDLLVSILDLDKPYEGGNLLFLRLSQKGDETEAPDGRRALTVESLMIPKRWDPDSFTGHQKGVMKHLFHLFPFLEEHIEYTDWDWAEKQWSCWSYPHFFYETASDFQWREGVVPNRLSKRFYFIGKENFPYLGMEGEVLSGLMVSQQILESGSKRSI